MEFKHPSVDQPRAPGVSFSSRSGHVWLIAAVVLAVGIVLHPVFAQPTATLFSPYSDILSQHHPFRYLLVQSIRERGCLPLWNPTAFAGMPLVGDPQSGIFYPPNWLHAVVSADECSVIFGPLMALHFVAGGWGMLWWLRGHDFAPSARLAGAIAFIFCGKWFYHLVVPGHVIFLPLVWLPWQCGLVDRIWEHGSRRCCGLLACVTALAVTGYHSQLLVYSQLLLLGYTLVFIVSRRSEHRLRSFMLLCVALIIALLLVSIHVLPIVDLLGSDVTIRGGGLPYEMSARRSRTLPDYISFLLPSTVEKGWEDTSYVGVVAAVLAFFGARCRGRQALAAYFVAIILFGLWFGLGEHGGLHRWLYDHVPGFNLLRIPTRIFLVFGLPVGYLCAAGLTNLELDDPTWPKKICSAFCVLGAAVLCYAYPTTEAVIAAAALALPACSQLLLPIKRIDPCGWAFVVLLFADQARFCAPLVQVKPLQEALGANPLVDRLRAPLGQQRVLAINYDRDGMFSPLPVTYSTIAGIENVRGFNPLVPRSTFRILQTSVGGKPLEWFYGTGIRNFPIAHRNGLDMLNVRWICSATPLYVDGFELRERLRDVRVYHFAPKTDDLTLFPIVYLYENTNVFPRAALIRRAVPIASVEQAAGRLADVDLHHEVLVEDAALAGDFAGDFRPLAVDHRGDEIHVKADAGAGAYLLLSELSFPGWHAEVDGASVAIRRGNGFFQLVPLGPGAHRVRLQYRPRSFVVGRWLAALGVVAALALLIPWPARSMQNH